MSTLTPSEDKGDGLRRQIGWGSATSLVIANMVGAGIFTTSGLILAELHNPRILLAGWLVGGVFALTGALCYGELGAMYPRAGGEYVFLKESFGKLPAFLSGWISLIVGFSAPIAAAAMSVVSYLSQVLPAGFSAPESGVEIAGILRLSPPTATACALIAGFSILHAASLEQGARIQNILTGFKLAVLLGLVAAGFTVGTGSWSHLGPPPKVGAVFSPAFATALIFISFAYSGWNAAAYLGAEIQRPQRNIPLALIAGTLSVMTLYLLLNLLFIYALPAGEMAGVVEIGAKSAAALFGPGIGRIFALLAAVCLLTVLSAMIMAGPRVYYAMARDGVFFSRFARVAPDRGTPAQAVFLQGAIAVLLVLTASFGKLLLYIGFTLSVFAALSVLGLFVLRRRGVVPGGGYRTPAYPLPPILFIAGNLWMIGYCLVENPMTALYGGGTILCGIPAYAVFRRRKALHFPRG